MVKLFKIFILINLFINKSVRIDNTKISIRFFNNHEVLAIWDEENSKWWFSVLDIIAVLNEQDDYNKVRNYWKYLKGKLRKENNELVSATNRLNLKVIKSL